MKIALIILVAIVFIGLVVWGVRTGMHNKTDTPAALEPNEKAGEEQQKQPEGERITTPEGLIYQDVTVGEGEIAATGDTVTVHYVGALEDGTVFDASTARGEPFSFRLGSGSVIEGWELGVAGMQVGGVRELVIPPDLAYGNQERGPIPAGSTLLFTVQLLGVEEN